MDGAVAVLVGIGAAQEYDVNREALVEQALLAFDVDNLDEILGGVRVQLAAAVAGIGKGVKADVSDSTNIVRRDIAVHVGDNALRQVVGFDLVVQRKLTQTGGAVPVAADNALYEALMAVMVAAGAIAVALACRKEQGQILRMAGFEEAFLKRGGKRFGAGAAYETAGCDGIAVIDQQGGFFRGQYTNSFHNYSTSFT